MDLCKLWSRKSYAMLLNKIVERNLYESKLSPSAGSRKITAIYIINTNDFFVQLKRGETLGMLLRLRANEEGGQGGEEVLTKDRNRHSCFYPRHYQPGGRGQGFLDHHVL